MRRCAPLSIRCRFLAGKCPDISTCRITIVEASERFKDCECFAFALFDGRSLTWAFSQPPYESRKPTDARRLHELRVAANTSPTIDRRTFVGAASLAALTTLRAPERLARSLLSTHTASKLADVNTTDIRSAIELGCRSMASLANADDRVVGSSHFGLVLRPIARLGFSEVFSDAQVPGRHLNALLTAEGRLGVTIDQSTIERLTRVVFFSYSGPVALPLNRKTPDGKLANFAPVNIAHGFHALYALAAYRQSAQALELAEKSIAAIHSLWKPSSGWDRARLENDLGLTYMDPFPKSPFIAGIAMAIGPLSKLYRATGSRAALALATELKDKALAEYFLASGEHDEERFGVHVHNVVYVMASLAWFATITGDAAVMNRVKAFYDNGLAKLRDAIGWSAEYSGLAPAGPNQTVNGDRGESGNSALILETALLLGRGGYPEYFADAELMLRSHLLPSQLRDVSFVAPESNPNNEDRSRDVARRLKGAWGMSAPYGQLPFATRIVYGGTDTVGTVVAALCEALARSRRSKQGSTSSACCLISPMPTSRFGPDIRATRSTWCLSAPGPYPFGFRRGFARSRLS